MARLPRPGQDDGTWGSILNDFLQQAHDTDGSIKDGSVSKNKVGLGNVDNTSDADKPVSSATQTALDAKADSATLAAVATSGSYADLSQKPTITNVTVDGVAPAGGAVNIVSTPVYDVPSVNVVNVSGVLTVGIQNVIDASAGIITMSLPTGQPVGTMLSVRKHDSSANNVVVTGNIAGTAGTTHTLIARGEVMAYRADANGSWWVVGGNKPLTMLDGRYVRTVNGTAPDNAGNVAVSAGSAVNIQVFSAAGNGTWTKPAGATTVSVVCVGAGGGGGSGRRGATGTIRGGGGGGAGGAWTMQTFPAALFGATEPVTVGTGGSGGTATTTDDTNGTNATAGGASIFSNGGSTNLRLKANGGAAGGAGIVGASTVATGAVGTSSGGNGANSSSTGGAGNAGSNGNSGAGGGASGGGISSANTANDGAAGGSVSVLVTFMGGTAGTAGGNGGNGTSPVATAAVGAGGGGGGGASLTAAGGSGGNGGAFGGGGGGGAASLNGFASGAGGNGGSGVIIVTSW